jgi:hypothetical protein
MEGFTEEEREPFSMLRSLGENSKIGTGKSRK